MELVLNICRSYSVEERRALALDLLTPSNYKSQECNQERNEAQQTVRFQFLNQTVEPASIFHSEQLQP